MKKIILFCAAGMSTSLLVNKIREAAKAEDFACQIDAYAISEAGHWGLDADCILLGPQVRFQLKKIKEQFPDKPVEAIDMTAYGMMDGKKVLQQAKNLM